MVVGVSEVEAKTREIWQALQSVPDPEIPVLSLVDLGIVRRVAVAGNRVEVDITPTFSGCPALDVMIDGVRQAVEGLGYRSIEVRTVLSPVWTTDDLSDEARAKLRDFGLSPPPAHGGHLELVLALPAVCPYCGSEDTVRKNDFGSTLCRSIHVCLACRQPFEAFKPM